MIVHRKDIRDFVVPKGEGKMRERKGAFHSVPFFMRPKHVFALKHHRTAFYAGFDIGLRSVDPAFA